MVEETLTFPNLACKELRGYHQSFIERLSAKLYFFEATSDNGQETRRDIFRTNKSSGQLETMTEDEATELKAIIKDSDLFDITPNNLTFEVSYVNPMHNPDGTQYEHFPVLRFHHDQLPDKKYLPKFFSLVARKQREQTTKIRNSIGEHI